MSRPEWNREGRSWPHRDASSFVEAAGLRWHVQQMGRGPALLLLHGTGSATHSWRRLMPVLADSFTVIAPDLPGHAFTSPPRQRGYSLPGMTAAVSGLLNALQIEPRLVIGHSAGAAIGMRMALDGAAFQGIVSINGALLPFPGVARFLFPSMARVLFVNPVTPRLFALQGQSRSIVSSFLARSTGSRIDSETAALYQMLFARSGHCEAALGMMAHWDLEDLERDLPKVTTPLLAVAGEADAAVPPSVARKVAAIVPDGKAVLLPRLGHLAQEEAADVVAPHIFAFAREHAIQHAAREG